MTNVDRVLAAEVFASEAAGLAAWAYARAAVQHARAASAGGWLRRLHHALAAGALERQARVHDREMMVWESVLYLELREREGDRAAQKGASG